MARRDDEYDEDPLDPEVQNALLDEFDAPVTDMQEGEGIPEVDGAAPPTSVAPVTPAPLPSAPAGWEASKWDTSTSPKYIYGRMATQYGTKTPDQRAALLAALKADPSGYFANATLNGDILSGLTDPAFDGITAFDVIQDEEGAALPAWQPVGGTYTGGGAGGTGAKTASVTPSVPSTSGTTPAAGPAESPYADELWQTLMGLITQDPNAVSISDPSLKPASDAYRLAQERARNERIDATAEQLAYSGLGDSGAMESGRERAFQDYGQATASYDANLVVKELESKREQVMQALQIGAGLLSREQENALRLYLTQLNQQLTREQMAQQSQQWYDDLGFRIGDRETYWNNFPYTLF